MQIIKRTLYNILYIFSIHFILHYYIILVRISQSNCCYYVQSEVLVQLLSFHVPLRYRSVY